MKTERGCCAPLLQKFGFTGGFPPSRAPAAPPRGPATRRITLPRPPAQSLQPHDVRPSDLNGWRGGAGSSAAQWPRAGTYVPTRARRRHCPLTRPRPWPGPLPERAPHAARCLWGPRSQGRPLECAVRSGRACEAGRAHPSRRAVTLCRAGGRARGPGRARGRRAAPVARAPPPADLSASPSVATQGRERAWL